MFTFIYITFRVTSIFHSIYLHKYIIIAAKQTNGYPCIQKGTFVHCYIFIVRNLLRKNTLHPKHSKFFFSLSSMPLKSFFSILLGTYILFYFSPFFFQNPLFTSAWKYAFSNHAINKRNTYYFITFQSQHFIFIFSANFTFTFKIDRICSCLTKRKKFASRNLFFGLSVFVHSSERRSSVLLPAWRNRIYLVLKIGNYSHRRKSLRQKPDRTSKNQWWITLRIVGV